MAVITIDSNIITIGCCLVTFAASYAANSQKVAALGVALDLLKATSITREVLDLRMLNMDLKLDTMQKALDRIEAGVSDGQHKHIVHPHDGG